MRLLFIDLTIARLFQDADFPVGGWAVELRAWLAGLAASGVESAILVDVEGARKAAPPEKVRLLPAYAARGRVPGVSYVFGFLPRMVQAARRWRPTAVVQAVAGINTGWMWALARLLGVPFIYRSANDIDVDARISQRLSLPQRVMFHQGLAGADGFVAQNGYQLEAFRRRFPGKPAIVLHNPFYEQSPPAAIATRAERGYVAWLGVFQPQKNLPALAAIARALPDVEFRIGGKNEVAMKDPATLEALRALEAMPNVRFMGYLRRTEVPGFLARAALLLSTSHYEGFSNTFLEAWAMGTPMVAPVGVDPDGLIASCGLGSAVADHADLAQATRALLALGEAEYGELSRRCREHVLTHHDPRRLAEALCSFIAGLETRR